MRSRPSLLRTAIGIPASALVGVVVGVMATFKATAGVAQGFPYGLLLGLLLVLVLVVALRLGVRGRRFGAAGAVGLLAAAGLLALPSAGGSVVVQPDAVGIGWLVGVAVAGAAGVAVPLPAVRTPDGILAADEREVSP